MELVVKIKNFKLSKLLKKYEMRFVEGQVKMKMSTMNYKGYKDLECYIKARDLRIYLGAGEEISRA